MLLSGDTPLAVTCAPFTQSILDITRQGKARQYLRKSLPCHHERWQRRPGWGLNDVRLQQSPSFKRQLQRDSPPCHVACCHFHFYSCILQQHTIMVMESR